MPTIEQLADFERCKPLIEAKYPAGNLEELARECGCDIDKLRQRARAIGVSRDKAIATSNRLSALRRAKTSPAYNRRKRFVRGPGNQKIYELMAIKRALLANGLKPLARLNNRIIRSIKEGAPYDDFLTIHDGWEL